MSNLVVRRVTAPQNHAKPHNRKKEKNPVDEKQVATTNRVLKKLSAMRATLSDSELNVLDQIVIGATTDVAAHKIAYLSADQVADKAADKTADVAAHKLVDRSADQVADKAADKTADVTAHKMADRSVDRATGKILERSTSIIIFDAEAEVYKLVD